MGDKVITRRARGRPAVIVLLVAAALLVMAVTTPSASAFGAWNHDGASCGTGCHVTNPVPGPGTNAECQGCHTGYQLRAGAPQNCWTCHAPAVGSTTALKQQAGCTGVCHFQQPGTSNYNQDSTPHGTTPHYASTIKNCRSCHGVALTPTNPGQSPHHDAVNSGAPTAADCLECHGTPVVDQAPPAHGDLGVGVTDCQHCHVGMSSSHPTAAQLLNPRLTVSVARSGADVTVRGTLRQGTTALVNFTGWVQWRGPADTTWDAARSLPITTDATGRFSQVVTAPAVGTAYRVLFEGGMSGANTISPVLARTSTNLTLRLSATSIRLGQRVRASGTVTPARTGRVTVTVQRRNAAGRWVRVTSSARTLTASGAYSWNYRPGRRGTYRMQARIAGTTLFAADLSPWRTFRVR